MGAAPVTMTRTRPPRDSCSQKGEVCLRSPTSCFCFNVYLFRLKLYLHFMEDEFVPYAVVPDDAFLHLSVFPVHGEVQQPFLERRFGSALNLSDTETLGLMFKAESERKEGAVVSRHKITNFVVDAVEESRHDWENGGLQSFHVIWQQSDVTLEESHPRSSTVQHRLDKKS